MSSGRWLTNLQLHEVAQALDRVHMHPGLPHHEEMPFFLYLAHHS